MTLENSLPAWIVLSSLLPGIAIFFLAEQQTRTRTVLNLSAAIGKLVLIGIVSWGVYRGRSFETRLLLLGDIDLVLHADSLSLLFAMLSAVLWLATTIYAIGYLEGSPHRSRFFGFFSLCVASTMGIALAGNLVTFFIFYELLTLSTYPLVIHRSTPEVLRAGDTYLRYTIGGGTILLAGIALLYALAGSTDFAVGGAGLADLSTERNVLLVIGFVLLIAGLAVKTAMVPVHAWLPIAMVAPAPVSALLHAVAVVKAGAFGITRVVYDVYGVRLAHDLGVLEPLAYVAAVTVLYGSLKALTQKDLKRRLAYSTVSQVSFIVLGVATFGTLATIGGIVHLVHQGLMKITLFFCAGNLSEELGLHSVDELHGVGKRMPVTMAAFTVAAVGMAGMPPVAGFITKWYLGSGALEAGEGWVIAVLLASSALNVAYYFPIVYRAWFGEPSARWRRPAGRAEVSPVLLLPTVATAVLALGAGLFAGLDASPLGWAKLIAAREFGP
jgi:multicomponent Na+:H+ antiporter subunit D